MTIPENQLEQRCIDRIDRAHTSWSDDMIEHYGSRSGVIEAILESTRRRREAALKSQLPFVEIDTASRKWKTIADQMICEWIRRRR